MNWFWRIAGLVVVPLLVGLGVYGYRQRELSTCLEEARRSVGSRSAVSVLTVLIGRHPEQAELYFLRGREFRLEEKPTRALPDMKRAMELGWPAEQVRREELFVTAHTDFKAAEPRLTALLEADPADREAALILAAGYTRQRRADKGLAMVQAVVAKNADDGPALFLRGQLLSQRRDLEAARMDLEAALRFGSDSYYYPAARLLLAICYLDLGQFDRALPLFREAHDDEPNDPKALYGIGRCARFLGRPEEAVDAFRGVLRLRPDHIDSMLQLAYLEESQGRLTEALKSLQAAEKLDPNWYEVPYRMAKVYALLGQPEQAAKHQQKYLEMRQRWAQRKPGQTLEEVMKAHEDQPRSPNLLDN